MIKPDFERLRKALLLEGEPDYVPKAELWIDSSIMSKWIKKEVGYPPYDCKNVIKFMSKAGYDYAHIVPAYNFKKGEHAAAMSAGIISNWEDFEKYPWPKKEEIDFGPVEKSKEHLPDNMKVISGSLAGIFEESWLTMGFDTLSISLLENKEFAKAMFDKVGEVILYIFENAASMEHVGALWLSDDIAYKNCTMVSPKLLNEFLFPWYKKIGAACKKNNKPFIYHSDGCLYPVLDDLINCGVNAVHPIEPLGMDISKLKKEYGSKLCLIGNIGLENELTIGTPKDVDSLVKKRIMEIAPGGGYCCGSSNTIPAYVPFENYKAMVKAIEKYGKYPIQL